MVHFFIPIFLLTKTFVSFVETQGQLDLVSIENNVVKNKRETVAKKIHRQRLNERTKRLTTYSWGSIEYSPLFFFLF